MSEYSLSLGTPTIPGVTPLRDITPIAKAWRRSIRDAGGYWQGSFRIEGGGESLDQWFENYLGYHVEEHVGSVKTWEGLIYEMHYEQGGLIRRRSFSDMFNSVNSSYIDKNDNYQETGYLTQQQSRNQYGRREQFLSYDGYQLAASQDARAEYLQANAWPYARPVGGATSETPSLEVLVCGYIFTANWRFTQVQDALTDQMHDYIKAILSTDCEFISAGKIWENPRGVIRATPTAMRAWDQLSNLVTVGSGGINRYRLWVGNDRLAHYEIVDRDPRYRLTKHGLLEMSGDPVNPFFAKPLVAKDYTYAKSGAQSGSWLKDARDFYIVEVTAGARSGLSFKVDERQNDEIRATRLEYDRWMREFDRREHRKRRRGK